MYSHSHAKQDAKSRAIANQANTQQVSDNPPLQFADQRPEAQNQRKLQELANKHLSSQQTTQLQSASNSPVQREANKTGLPDKLKSGVENLSGQSMNDVKVNLNSREPAKMQAHAFAQGSNIHVAPGQERHLPHEAWHVAQQKQGRVQPTGQVNGMNLNDNQGLEKEADRMGKKAVQMKSSEITDPLNKGKGKATIQRLGIYYDSKGVKQEFKSFDEIITFLKSAGKNAPEDLGSKVITYLNKEFAKKKLVFDENLMNHFLSTSEVYFTGMDTPDLMKSIMSVYEAGIENLEKEAGDKEGGDSYKELLKTYKETEENDGDEVEDEFKGSLACTLFALLAVRGTFLGAKTPEELHYILRTIEKFKVYDDDAMVGLLRMMAGLSYSTDYKGQTVGTLVDSLKEGDQNRAFIIDLDSVAHTFALKYEGGKWKRFDNGSAKGYVSGMEIGKYLKSKISVTWE